MLTTTIKNTELNKIFMQASIENFATLNNFY